MLSGGNQRDLEKEWRENTNGFKVKGPDVCLELVMPYGQRNEVKRHSCKAGLNF